MGLPKFLHVNRKILSKDFVSLKLICSKADFVIRESLQLLEQLVQSRGTVTEESFAMKSLKN